MTAEDLLNPVKMLAVELAVRRFEQGLENCPMYVSRPKSIELENDEEF